MGITKDKFNKAKQCLVDNGIEYDKTEAVLQAICYILLDEEAERLFSDDEVSELERSIQNSRQIIEERKEQFSMFRKDIITYLTMQDDEYFRLCGYIKEKVLSNERIIDDITAAHRDCVIRIGCDRVWSCKNTCDSMLGFR